MPQLEPHLPARRVAKILGVKTKTLAAWRRSGRGPSDHFRVSKTLTVYPTSSVEQFLRERKENA